MSGFSNLSGADRRSATALLNSYNRKIARWQREADLLYNRRLSTLGAVNLQDYIGYSDRELAGMTSLQQFRASLDARNNILAEKIQTLGDRADERSRERRASARLTQSVIKKAGGKPAPRKRGRPQKWDGLTEGQLIYFATAYNHGLGAHFRGYGVAEDGKGGYGATHINQWL